MDGDLDPLRYPIGPFQRPPHVTDRQVADWIAEMAALPAALRALVTPFSAEQLATPYRPGGWTVTQVVHHMADSHLNSLVRFKWALTEERPTIKAYWEERWAQLPDYSAEWLELSLTFFEALQARLCVLLRSLDTAQLDREFVHPDSGPVSLRVNIGIYAWHGRHHLAHIAKLAERAGWGG